MTRDPASIVLSKAVSDVLAEMDALPVKRALTEYRQRGEAEAQAETVWKELEAGEIIKASSIGMGKAVAMKEHRQAFYHWRDAIALRRSASEALKTYQGQFRVFEASLNCTNREIRTLGG